jgi:hypothetical protein
LCLSRGVPIRDFHRRNRLAGRLIFLRIFFNMFMSFERKTGYKWFFR